MQCLFLLRSGRAYYCEVCQDRYGDTRQLLSSWVCKHGWETLCPYYFDAMNEDKKAARRPFDEMQAAHPFRMGHFNRIGGYRAGLSGLN